MRSRRMASPRAHVFAAAHRQALGGPCVEKERLVAGSWPSFLSAGELGKALFSTLYVNVALA